jgi:protocatechuate 3,4-dioxygenase beta subunit
MKRRTQDGRTRREFLAASLATPALLLLDPLGLGAFAATAALEPTPACGDPEDLTPPQGAGPFFKPRSPERKSLIEPGTRGARIVLQGRVLSTRCKAIAGALMDFWQADAAGSYDNAGYGFRGHQFSDDQGRYRLETIVPGAYSGRTRHFHVRVQPPNQTILTTQLYFPGEPANERDWLYNPKLLISSRDSAGGKAAAFDFALSVR